MTGKGWIEWKGGDCPVRASSIVKARFRDLACVRFFAGLLDWKHHGEDLDIIAYRVIKE